VLLAVALYVPRYALPLFAGELETRSADLFIATMLFAFATVGWLIATRQPSNSIGWVFLGVAVSLGLAGFARGFVTSRLQVGDESAVVGLAAMYSEVSWVPFILVPATVLLLLFPDGRLPSRRWRWIARCAVVGMVGAAVTDAIVAQPISDYPGLAKPFSVSKSIMEPFYALSYLTLFIGIVGSVAAIVARYRSAGPVLRLQLRWLATAGVVAAVTFFPAIALYDVVPVAEYAIMLSVLGLPAAAGVAMLRYRLYDIDVVINRTLVYGGLTAALAAAYAVSVLMLQLILSPSSSDLAVAASTLAVAALFRPVRARIQSLVDRRFFRRRYDAQLVLEAFAARLRDEVSLDAVQHALRHAVHDTVAPAHASVWLRPR
jgi:hypothetical protein